MDKEIKYNPTGFEKKWPRKRLKHSRGKQAFNPTSFEGKWQHYWEKVRIYQPDLKRARKPFYNLMMFPYPSAEGLHVGNVYAFTGADIYGRFKRMQGFEVFEPIGLDGFGIHSENYALKVGRHPKEQAIVSERNFYRQLHATGNGFAWENTLETYDPNYYKRTQWIFIQMFKHGLAYRKKSLVNFCPSCKTVLSDEQVIDGHCERCKSLVEKREMEQWFFKITAYGEKLYQNTFKESFKWSGKVKVGQRNWIGRKEGINITYPILSDTGPTKEKITCFTTRPDTNFGATFVVVAPEHDFVATLLNSKLKTQSSKLTEIEKYVKRAKAKSEMERIAEGREKTGVFTGYYAVNQLNDYKMPIFISDFVLGHFGTGAVVGVAGHDARDFQFANKFKLKIIRVVVGKNGDKSEITREEQVQEEEGTMVNSEFLNGMDIHEATEKIMDYLEEKGWGKRVTTYRLRDWCISRQRYWGAPIPMIYCKKCASTAPAQGGWYPVAEKDLPVELPDVSDWKPEGTGKGPLSKVKSFVETKCPNCKGPALRETDVCDTFLDSSWYFLRYPSVNKESDGKNIPWDPDITKKWLPVDQYTGGAEHTVLHLLYARFITMALKDFGYLDFEEPFEQFYAHGLIIAEGAKMSKSRGNVVIPDAYINKYGADTLRTYLMFLGPFDQGGDFRDTGIAGMHRFLNRVWRLGSEVVLNQSEVFLANTSTNKLRVTSSDNRRAQDTLTRSMHKTIKEVTDDIAALKYNTAIAHIMEYVNEISNVKSQMLNLDLIYIKNLLLLLAPFAPFITEELWNNLALGRDSIHIHPWPSFDPKYLKEEKTVIIIQVNGKLRDSLKIASLEAKKQQTVEKEARKSGRVSKYLEGQKIKKTVFVPGKLINFVI